MYDSFCNQGCEFFVSATPCSSFSTKSMESSIHVDIVSVALGYSLWYFFACCCSTNRIEMEMNSPWRRSCRICWRLEGGPSRVISTKSCDTAYLIEEYHYVDTSPRCHILLQLIVVEIAEARQINPVVAWALQIYCHSVILPQTVITFLAFVVFLSSLSTGNWSKCHLDLQCFLSGTFAAYPVLCIVQCINHMPLLCRVLFWALFWCSPIVIMPCCNCLVRILHYIFMSHLLGTSQNIIDSSTFCSASCSSVHAIGILCSEGVLSISQNFLRFQFSVLISDVPLTMYVHAKLVSNMPWIA